MTDAKKRWITAAVYRPLKIADIAAPILLFGLFAVSVWWSLHPSFYYLEWMIFAGLATLTILGALTFHHFLDWVHRRLSQPRPRIRHRAFNITLGLIALWTIGLFFQLPLRLAFVTAWPSLSRAVRTHNPSTFAGLTSNIVTPLFTISAETTNVRLDSHRTHGYNTNRIILFLRDDSDSAFIYSPDGIDNLAYNSGSAGHLFGAWYWMAED